MKLMAVQSKVVSSSAWRIKTRLCRPASDKPGGCRNALDVLRPDAFAFSEHS
jgi:hypothetical protein